MEQTKELKKTAKYAEMYFILLTAKEQLLLKHALGSLNAGTASLTAPQRNLVQLLCQRPYPVLQILKQSREKARYQVGRIIAEALQQILENEKKEEISLGLVSFIANFPLDILESASLCNNLITHLATPNLNDATYLALLSRAERTLLDDVLSSMTKKFWQECSSNSLPKKEFVLFQAMCNGKHFVPLMSSNLKHFQCIADIAVRHNLLILKVLQEFCDPKQSLANVGNIGKWLEVFKPNETPIDLQEVHQFFYADFQRFCVILEFLRKYPEAFKALTVGSVLKANGILKIIYESDINASFDEVRRVIDSLFKWQRQMPGLRSTRDIELQTWAYFTTLSTIYDVIMADRSLGNETLESFYVSKMQQLNSIMRQLRNFDALCSLLEDIFKLVFLRWEKLEKITSQFERSKSAKTSSCTDSDVEIDNERPPITRQSSNTGRHGFVCRGRALYNIFIFLKNFVAKKVHSEDYKFATESVQLRFQRIVDNITEALWKYAVLEKIDDALSRADSQEKFQLGSEQLFLLVRTHVSAIEKSSSDDESRERATYTNLTRRKSTKKRRRATFCGGTRPQSGVFERAKAPTNMTTSIDNYSERETTTMTNRNAPMNTSKVTTRLTDRSIIPQMLGSPENLAIMALALKNFDDVKYIIQTFNLQNSELNRELKFMEQQQQDKLKLAAIYANYKRQDEQFKDPNRNLATVEQIKTVAAKGFEVSKIINIIDNFAQTHKLQQSQELKQLLSKHIASNEDYSFLRHFEERNLNAVIIIDLVLNLPLNRELTSNVLNVIKRQQHNPNVETPAPKKTGKQSKLQFSRDIGVVPFLENMVDCMRLLQDNYSLRELLTNNYYSLQPLKLAVELQREAIFRTVFHKSHAAIARYTDLQSFASHFQDLNGKRNYYARFSIYVAHLTRLVKLRDRNLELHLSELLKIDPCAIIGELIFECNMTPLEIETNVAALNLNLVHVIALNISPEIGGRAEQRCCVTTPQKQETILNYISQQHHLLGCLLESIINRKCFAAGDRNLSPIYLERYLELPEIERLSALYEGNQIVATLRSDHINMELLGALNSKLQQLELLRLEIGNRDQSAKQRREIDKIVVSLIEADARNIHLSEYINDLALKAKLIQENFTKMATTLLAKHLIKSTLHHRDSMTHIPTELRKQLEVTLLDITIYAQVSEVLHFETWPQAYDFFLKTPNVIFQKLLRLHLYKLCYEWCGVVKLAERFSQFKRNLLATLLEALLELNDDDETNIFLLRILETFPRQDCFEFLDKNKDQFRSLLLLQYAIDFLMKYGKCDEHNAVSMQQWYRSYQISLYIFRELSQQERDQFWHLLKYPLLIVEQLIMNAKFEVLAKVLDAVRKSLNDHVPKGEVCDYCFGKRGHAYDINTRQASNATNSPARHKLNFKLGVDNASMANSAHSAFMLLNFNLYQQDHFVTHECIDLLLRIYATKALDYHVADTYSSSSERVSQTTDVQQSLDSLCGVFQMPKQAPRRADWIQDDQATHCMCCRRVAFTMLMRRHHCRRCGRVVCFACSSHRMLIPELYANVEVRVCNDCHRSSEDSPRKATREGSASKDGATTRTNLHSRPVDLDVFKWQLSGNITHDKLLREEFCYEHAPSVALCLSILGHHLGQEKCVDLLLYHCLKLEKLIVPNPEVDYELVAKMMNCLALAAKVRSGPAGIESIREHSEIILSIVQNGCESLIPPGPLNDHSLRKLADALVQAENWPLALEVHLKWGLPTAGVMAAHGLACLRAGCFDTAREKLSHCMPKLSSEQLNFKLEKHILQPNEDNNDSLQFDKVRRPQRGPPLLQEILTIIESTAVAKPQPETLHRASIIRNSNTSLASLLSRRKEVCAVPSHEPALNVLTTLANLKRIAKGDYGMPEKNTDNQMTRRFEECLYYVLTYGSHADVVQFLMHHKQLKAALRYFVAQQLSAELFIQYIYLVCLRCGEVPLLIEYMLEFDARLQLWQHVLIQTCRYLENQNLLNSLYQLQLLLKDPIRASMTCVKFYSKDCENFQQMHANSEHLQNAQRHLQSELESAHWEQNLNVEQAKSATSFLVSAFRVRKNSNGGRRLSNASTASSVLGGTFLMQMDARALNTHINTILTQLDVAKFLAKCEKDSNQQTGELLTLKLLKQIRLEANKAALPTLFDGTTEKIQICILILYCGKNIEEGFGLSYRIIQDYKLPALKVFAGTAKYLAKNQRLAEVEHLLNCITSNNGTNKRDIDEILSVAINSAVNSHEPEVKTALDSLTNKISSIELRISCHIFIGQLKSAYLLANKYERLNDIRKIQRQAELSNQIHIKRLCDRKLSMSTSTTSSVLSQASE